MNRNRELMEAMIPALNTVAVDTRTFLSSNIADIPDCTGQEFVPKTEIIDRFPLVNWLLGTRLTQRVRSDISNNCLTHKDCESGKWVIEIPRELWTLVPESSETQECCWAPFDFAKCGGNAPLNLLCLKDCRSMEDILMERVVGFGNRIEGIANQNEKIEEVRRRVNRLSMAFYSAYTIVQGMSNVYTNILKPFHGLMEVLENPAVAVIEGTNILSAFASAACRMAILGLDGFVFAVHPVIYQSILNVVTPDMYGNLPYGWSRNGDEVTFRGMRFIQDKAVPVDMDSATGEIWVLNSEAVGLYLATDLQPASDFVFDSGHNEETLANGCASECTYYYNMGAVLNNNANKIMRIVDVPIAGACTASIGDLESIVMPQTLIPRV